MNKLYVKFTFEKETKNTFRYAEVVEGDAEPVIGTLYVKKSALEGKAEPTIEISILGGSSTAKEAKPAKTPKAGSLGAALASASV